MEAMLYHDRLHYSFSCLTGVWDTTVEKLGPVNLLVNNAGIGNEQKWEKTIEVNLVSCFTDSGKEGMLRVVCFQFTFNTKESMGQSAAILPSSIYIWERKSLKNLNEIPWCQNKVNET